MRGSTAPTLVPVLKIFGTSRKEDEITNIYSSIMSSVQTMKSISSVSLYSVFKLYLPLINPADL